VVEARERDCLEDLRLVEMGGECADQQLASEGPSTVAAISAAPKSTLPANRAIWTPHSYSQPSRAVVRSITISRWRRLSGPLSSRPPANTLPNTRGLRAMVRNSSSGSTPAGMMRSSASAMAGG